jgi:hypothetical protein
MEIWLSRIFEVGETGHRAGQLVQQAGHMYSSSESKNC